VPVWTALLVAAIFAVVMVGWADAGDERRKTRYLPPVVVLGGAPGLGAAAVGIAAGRLALSVAGPVVAAGLAMVLYGDRGETLTGTATHPARAPICLRPEVAGASTTSDDQAPPQRATTTARTGRAWATSSEHRNGGLGHTGPGHTARGSLVLRGLGSPLASSAAIHAVSGSASTSKGLDRQRQRHRFDRAERADHPGPEHEKCQRGRAVDRVADELRLDHEVDHRVEDDHQSGEPWTAIKESRQCRPNEPLTNPMLGM
jgi:hypothetical protein